MADAPNEPDPPKDAPATAPAEAAPPEPPGESPEAPPQAETPAPAETPADSATFSRCAECRNSEAVNTAAGTLVCKKHNMLINAEADEIPDDCVEHEAKDG